jgi:ankyrin repeat protein
VDSRDRGGLTALYRSPRYKHRGVVDDLLRAGADPNARCGPLGRTPLHSAYRNPWAVSTLRAAGAAVDAEDRHGERPLHLAATSCHRCVSLLCAYGASVDATMDGGLTPLHRAAASFQPRAVAELIEGGADVNARTDSGETPLHLAARSRAKGLSCYSLSLEILEALLRAGADENLLDGDGRSPVDVVGADAGEAGLYEFDAAQFEKMRARLLSAPADRAWRRRGYLVMLRVGPRGLSTRSGRGAARVGRELSARKRRKSSGWVESLGWLVSETSGAPIEVFRTVVSYL